MITVCTQDNPGVMARPPRIMLTFLLFGTAVQYVWPLSLLPNPAQFSIGAVIIAIGIGLMTLAVRRFNRVGTNVPTCLPVHAIITDGIYRYTRNPMYLSGMLLFVGIGIAADNPWILALLIPFFAIVRYGVIAREERYLEGKFGERYLNYKSSVPRWL
jgi:protein-S-isoprenylcysteine O-methyltransferase Ste14